MNQYPHHFASQSTCLVKATSRQQLAMIVSVLTITMCLLTPVTAAAQQEKAMEVTDVNVPAKNAVVGLWASENSIFEISIENDTLKGQVRALLNPTYLSEESNGRQGEIRTDDNNPEESLRSRPLIGLSMFSEYKFTNDQWQGKLYDPESGNTYQSRMKLNKNRELEIRGYIGMPMFGRTAVFVPASSCSQAIVDMLPQLSSKNAVQCSKSPD